MNIKSHNGILYYMIIFVYFLLVAGCRYSITEKPADIESKQAVKPVLGKLNPNAPKETIQIGQLIGEWDCISKDLVSIEDSAVWFTNDATWKWEYILGGHALLNNWWQEDTSPNPVTKEYFAAGIFIFNPETELWEASIMNSRPHKISPKFQLYYQNEKLQMHDGSGKWLVTFFDIKQDTFEWKYEILTETGNWKAISRISARRKN